MPSLDRLIERVRALARSKSGDARLEAMLPQSAPALRGLSMREAETVRAQVLASFEHRRLSAPGLRILQEELRTSPSPRVLAGAARAVRGLGDAGAEWCDLLRSASERLAIGDEFVQLDGPHLEPKATAREEIARTIALLEVRPKTCCGGATKTPPPAAETIAFSLSAEALAGVRAEDQAQRQVGLIELLQGRSSLVAFFYTRCMNPAKCSLTITRLGRLAQRLESADLPSDFNLIAISYDPAFDTPRRLAAYGRERGFPFGERARLMRCTTGWTKTRQAFDLAVGYGASTVNEHARELFHIAPDLTARSLDSELLADADRTLEAIRAASQGWFASANP